MEALTKPYCDSCNIKFENMKQTDVHMKNVHGESLDLRIIRLTKAVETVRQHEQISLKQTSENIKIPNKNDSKIFDCSECGILCLTNNEYTNHIKKDHNLNIKRTNTKEERIFEIPKKIYQNQQFLQIPIQPQEGWLSKSLPNLEDLLATIPLNNLVSKEDELKS